MPVHSLTGAAPRARPSTFEEADTQASAHEMMDEPSFEAFYRRTAGHVRAYVVRVVGNTAIADDIVQEAYLRLLRSLPATRDEQELRAYLFRITSNLMADDWRRHKREPLLSDEHVPERGIDGPDIALRVDMIRTFERLPLQQRQLLWLAYVEGVKHRDIATALGLREQSVRVLLHRAKRKLARLLGL